MKLLYWARIKLKLFIKNYRLIPSFCKKCGRDVHDFYVSDKVWNKISKNIRNGDVLCYDCFCHECEKVGLASVWELKDSL